MTSYKLVYFNLKGRAEVIRTLFELADQKYEDERVEFAEWSTLKDKQVFKQLPVLHITDTATNKSTAIAQTNAIVRFVAEKFGFAGKNDIEKAQCDMLNEQIRDIFDAMLQVFIIGFPFTDYTQPDSDEKKEKLKRLFNEIIPSGYKPIQNILEANTAAGGNGFLVGNSLTYVDIVLINNYDWLRERKDEVLSKFPALKQHEEKIKAIPKIAEHIKKYQNLRLTILFAD